MTNGKCIIKSTISRLAANSAVREIINLHHGEEITASTDIVAYSFLSRKAASYGHEDALRYLGRIATRQTIVFNKPINHHAGERIPRPPACH